MVFHWCLSDRKSPQVSRTPLRILVNLTNVVVWMVSAHPPISNSSRPLYQAFRDCSECTNYNWHHRHILVPRPGQITFISFCFLWLSTETAKSTIWLSLSLSLSLFSHTHTLSSTITRSDLLAEIRWFIWLSKSQRILCVLFSRTDSGLCICYIITEWFFINHFRRLYIIRFGWTLNYSA